MTINIELEEYKELLYLKIQKEFQDKIAEMETAIKDAKLNEEYWYDRYCEARKKVEDLSDEIQELRLSGLGNVQVDEVT